ncbi:MAG: hypothetical protein Q7J24_00090 [Desulfomicrobium sp.]|nr:hypothetical protein [Desulfomicrobium sp.]
MFKTTFSIFLFFILGVFSTGCSTKVVYNTQIPENYVKDSKIEKYDIQYNDGVLASRKLISQINFQLKEKIDKMNANGGTQKISINVHVSQVKIANVGSTLMLGAFVGNNELNGFVIVHDYETNKIISSYAIEVDKNYGGYSAFFDLEQKMAEEFADQILRQINS